MIRQFLQKILTNPVIRLADKFSSRPDRTIIFQALSNLLQNIYTTKGDKGLVIEQDIYKDKFLILSDLHKGAKTGRMILWIV